MGEELNPDFVEFQDLPTPVVRDSPTHQVWERMEHVLHDPDFDFTDITDEELNHVDWSAVLTGFQRMAMRHNGQVEQSAEPEEYEAESRHNQEQNQRYRERFLQELKRTVGSDYGLRR